PAARRDLAARLRAATSGTRAPVRGGDRVPAGDAGESWPEEIRELRAKLRQHPCHRCPDRDRHARAAERRAKLRRDTAALRDRAVARTGSLARTFDQVCAVLTSRGYLTRDGKVTPAGRTLARVWTESDLLVAECLRRGVWRDLDAAQLAAAVSVVVY